MFSMKYRCALSSVKVGQLRWGEIPQAGYMKTKVFHVHTYMHTYNSLTMNCESFIHLWGHISRAAGLARHLVYFHRYISTLHYRYQPEVEDLQLTISTKSDIVRFQILNKKVIVEECSIR